MKGLNVMKKIISLLLIFVLACAMLVSCGETEPPVDPDAILNIDPNLPVEEGFGLEGKTPTDLALFKTEELADGTVKIKGCKIEDMNKLEEVVVPAVINGKKVSVIGESAFANLNNVKTIIIGDYVTEIQAYAFRDCAKLATIKLPAYVKTLGEGAFSGCSSIEKMDFLPMSVETLGARVFENCTKLTNVIIPNSVSKVGAYTFVGCSNIVEVTFSKRMTEIPERMFMGCKTLSNTPGAEACIVLPEGITSIGQYAFFECQFLTSITIPEGVTKIGKNAFDTCRRLERITIPSTVTSIGEKAFNTCNKLVEVTFLCGKDAKIGANLFTDSKKIETFNVKAGSSAETYCKDWEATIKADSKLDKSYEDFVINVTE